MPWPVWVETDKYLQDWVQSDSNWLPEHPIVDFIHSVNQVARGSSGPVENVEAVEGRSYAESLALHLLTTRGIALTLDQLTRLKEILRDNPVSSIRPLIISFTNELLITHSDVFMSLKELIKMSKMSGEVCPGSLWGRARRLKELRTNLIMTLLDGSDDHDDSDTPDGSMTAMVKDMASLIDGPPEYPAAYRPILTRVEAHYAKYFGRDQTAGPMSDLYMVMGFITWGVVRAFPPAIAEAYLGALLDEPDWYPTETIDRMLIWPVPGCNDSEARSVRLQVISKLTDPFLLALGRGLTHAELNDLLREDPFEVKRVMNAVFNLQRSPMRGPPLDQPEQELARTFIYEHTAMYRQMVKYIETDRERAILHLR